MGGGGQQENISGLFNGVNISTLSVSMSSNLAPDLIEYIASDVEDGIYDASQGSHFLHSMHSYLDSMQ
ncbi:MAG: hypothetical protein GY928_18315 [Colwellia sp.]|nr:hypothetical protein [Colwellia sp.]